MTPAYLESFYDQVMSQAGLSLSHAEELGAEASLAELHHVLRTSTELLLNEAFLSASDMLADQASSILSPDVAEQVEEPALDAAELYGGFLIDDAIYSTAEGLLYVNAEILSYVIQYPDMMGEILDYASSSTEAYLKDLFAEQNKAVVEATGIFGPMDVIYDWELQEILG